MKGFDQVFRLQKLIISRFPSTQGSFLYVTCTLIDVHAKLRPTESQLAVASDDIVVHANSLDKSQNTAPKRKTNPNEFTPRVYFTPNGSGTNL